MVDKVTFSFIKLEIREKFINQLYDFSLTQIVKEINNLVKQNYLLFNKINTSSVNYFCVMHNNKYYFDQVYSKRNYTFIVEKGIFNLLFFHEDLKKEFIIAFKELDDIRDEKSKNIIYINQILNISRNASDVFALVPKALHKYIPLASPDIGESPTLSNNIVEQHKEKYHEIRTFLKQRLITDLLLKSG